MTASTPADRDPQRLTPKGRATRERILAAAVDLMAERGVAGTSIEDVRESAGVSPSQIYHYFLDKQALVCAVITRQTEALLQAQQPTLSRLDSMEALRAWRDHLVDMQCRESRCPISLLGYELAERDEEARKIMADGIARWEQAIRDGLYVMRYRGDLRPETDPERLALATLAAVQGGILLARVRRDTKALESALDVMLDCIASLTQT